MKRNRKILAVAGAAVLVIAIGTASVLGVSAHAKNTAKETALKYLPTRSSSHRRRRTIVMNSNSTARSGRKNMKLRLAKKQRSLPNGKVRRMLLMDQNP